MPKRKSAKHNTQKTRRFSHRFDFFSRGNITFKILMLIIVVGAVMLAGGIFPKYQITPRPDGSGFFTPVDDGKTVNEKSLQLKTLKFKQCGETAAVSMMLDRTGSMGMRAPDGEIKINKLKNATTTFVHNLSDDSVIGIQSFDSGSITNDVPLSIYKDVKALVDAKINALRPGGSTPTTDALRFSYNILKTGKDKFPNRKIAFIFVSDGEPVPATQDPRLPQNAPDPSVEIKKLGITVYSIGILDAGQIRSGEMKVLLEHIASDPSKAFIAPDGAQLTEIYNQIRFQLCGEAK